MPFIFVASLLRSPFYTWTFLKADGPKLQGVAPLFVAKGVTDQVPRPVNIENLKEYGNLTASLENLRNSK